VKFSIMWATSPITMRRVGDTPFCGRLAPINFKEASVKFSIMWGD